MPDENRVFDVSKPSKVSPTPTSRPVIVGHHPMSDPMVKGEHDFGGAGVPGPTKIQVNDESPTVEDALARHQAAASPLPEEPSVQQGSPAVFSDPADEPDVPAIIPEANHPESVARGPFTDTEPKPAAPEPELDLPEPSAPVQPHIEGLHFAPSKPRRRPLKMILLGLLLLIIAAYLLIDSGAVGSGIKLPFHVFKQKTQPATPPAPASNQPAAAQPSVPAGFKEYKLAGTELTFAAPIAWGDPTSVTDPGFSKRGAGTQSDGTYAYLVNFAANKDVQVAVTSSKFLPAQRSPQYYDYLQWCTGSNDGLIYESVLNFTTANKVDTPTTITCSQGPVAGASKIDSSTIVQTKAADTGGKVIGDIYTENLNDPSLVVFRVKDAAMTNGTEIKQLLKTVKLPASPGTSSSSQ